MSSAHLNLMLDYLYTGETEVLQADLEAFLKSAQMLQIDGLTFGEELLNEEIKEEEVNPTLDVKETKNTADKFISEVTAEAGLQFY